MHIALICVASVYPFTKLTHVQTGCQLHVRAQAPLYNGAFFPLRFGSELVRMSAGREQDAARDGERKGTVWYGNCPTYQRTPSSRSPCSGQGSSAVKSSSRLSP